MVSADKGAVKVCPTQDSLSCLLIFVLTLALLLFTGTFNSKVEMPPLTAAENNLLNGDKGDDVWVSSFK